MKRVYLDHSATTPIDPDVLQSMHECLQSTFGNASSIHWYGREAKAVLERSREAIAHAIDASPEEIVLTSGGTESDNYAVLGVARAGRKRGKNHIVVSAIEHHAVLDPALALRDEGYAVDLLEVNENGIVDVERAKTLLRPETSLLSVMHSNNETGAMQPIKELALLAHEAGAVIHTDAVQSLGKVPLDVHDLGIDLLTISAHKSYGPKGIGALYIRRGTPIDRLIHGGGQESKRRAGTENTALAIGFSRALEKCLPVMAEESQRLQALRDYLHTKIAESFEGTICNTPIQQSLPHILSVSFDSSQGVVDGEALIMGMDLRGFAVTSGSACTSGTLSPSHVLRAMGRDLHTARATVRFSLGRSTTMEDIDASVDALIDVVTHLRSS
ncbi:MAG: cysteine desulfurase [Ignavibacteria bacterium]|nr:cysteine desulfurase [Ignavibacteria bacterium]